MSGSGIHHLSSDERETLRVAVARHQMKLRPIMVEQHLRDLVIARAEVERMRPLETLLPVVQAHATSGCANPDDCLICGCFRAYQAASNIAPCPAPQTPEEWDEFRAWMAAKESNDA